MKTKTNTLTPELLHKMDAYWRAANYLSVGQICLYDNPLLTRPLGQLLRGYGWAPYFVEGHDPALMHQARAATLDTVVEQIKKIQQDASVHGNLARPRWPMIVLNLPKGWTGPKVVARDCWHLRVDAPGRQGGQQPIRRRQQVV